MNELFELYTYYTYESSIQLAEERGTFELYPGSEYDKGILLGRKSEDFEVQKQFTHLDWKGLFARMKTHGVRFGYVTGPAPNTSTA